MKTSNNICRYRYFKIFRLEKNCFQCHCILSIRQYCPFCAEAWSVRVIIISRHPVSLRVRERRRAFDSHRVDGWCRSRNRKSIRFSRKERVYRIPAPREKFLHERRRNRDKQRAISAAIHFRAKERQTSRKYFSMSTRIEENDFRDNRVKSSQRCDSIHFSR